MLFGDETMGLIKSLHNLKFNLFFELEELSFMHGHCNIEVHHSWILSHVFSNLMILGFCEWCFYFASVDEMILQFAKRFCFNNDKS
jgi:hypothetical protein